MTTSGTLSIHVAYSDASADDHTTPTGSQSVSLTHSFSKAGTYSVHVTITSSTSEAAASASTSVEVRSESLWPWVGPCRGGGRVLVGAVGGSL